jgi:beta-lactam-binding protein with PASTA domain
MYNQSHHNNIELLMFPICLSTYMNIYRILWLFPFLSFIGGYYLTAYLFRTPTIQTPSLIGKSLSEALAIASHNNLNIRLLDEKNDADIAPGTIINQTPRAGQKIKAHQSLYVVITRSANDIHAPNFLKKTMCEVEVMIKKVGIRAHIYHVPSSYPSGYCCAQYPCSEQPITREGVILYMSAPKNSCVLWPDFKGQPVEAVIDFLETYSLRVSVNRSSDAASTESSLVINQHPATGCLIPLHTDKPPHIQLQIQ